jgi:hypothetical protein
MAQLVRLLDGTKLIQVLSFGLSIVVTFMIYDLR